MCSRGIPESSRRKMFEKAFDKENVEALKKVIASMLAKMQSHDARQRGRLDCDKRVFIAGLAAFNTFAGRLLRGGNYSDKITPLL